MYVVELDRIYIFERFVRAPARTHMILDRSRRSKSSFARGYSVNRFTRESINFYSRILESINRILLSKSLSLKIPFSKNSFLEKCPSLKISFSQNPFLAKCPSRKISSFLKSLSQNFLLVREGFSLLYVRWVGGWLVGGRDGAAVLDVF